MKKHILIISISIASIILVFCIACFFAWLINYNNSEETSLPRFDIKVDEKIDSKEEYISCLISISNTSSEYELSEASAGIRGRGNTTWNYPKKPYRIKFDKKTSLFGEAANKSWVLLAMYNDFSLSKDALAFSLANALQNGDYVPSFNYVDVYINGKYNGLYLLTEHINENKGRTDVKDDFNEADIAVPFLVEIDQYAEEDGGTEGVDYFKIGNTLFSIKYPDAEERYTDAQFEYIKNYIQKVQHLAYKKDVSLSEFSQYVDIESFIDYYIIQELMIQSDINYKSVYMSKSIDGKLKMGPIWDFDWSLDGPSLFYWFKYKPPVNEYASKGSWFYSLISNSEEFRNAVKVRWAEIEDEIRQAAINFEEQSDYISKGAKRDWLRWHWYNHGAKYEKNLKIALQFLNDRINWLDNEINNL